MQNFWDYNVWGFVLMMSVVGISLLLANLLKKSFRFLKYSLIPTSVLAGILLLLVAVIYHAITGDNLFNSAIFGGDGVAKLEILTYHCLALGFIATTFSTGKNTFGKKRNIEIFNTGVTTVSTYLLQAVLGLGITLIVAAFVVDFFSAAGVLLPFGYGQGSGQAMNYGTIYENDYGFVGGKSFGLSIAALGFLSAAIGGVIHLNILRRKGKISSSREDVIEALNGEDIQSADEIPMNGSIDKSTVQVCIIFAAYLAAYVVIFLLGEAIATFKTVLYGFNFLFGVLMASLLKLILNKLHERGTVKKQYINHFLMKRLTGFFFDVMIVAGIAAIQVEFLAGTWPVLLILGVVGAFTTYWYNHYVAKKLFPEYTEQQFLAMYGMLTGTASTGIILLREMDPEFKSPASDNLVYQNFPAIVFGFPMMLLATLAPKQPVLTFIILVAFFIAMNVILFRSFLFRRKKK